jgi:hypothetical protein
MTCHEKLLWLGLQGLWYGFLLLAFRGFFLLLGF